MTNLSKEILANWQVRKSKKSKEKFLQFMQQQIPEAVEEKCSGGRNLIIGDIAKAKILFTAHYDTCARLPFPNFITPYNFAIYLGYQLLLMFPFFFLLAAISAVLYHAGISSSLSTSIAELIAFGLMFFIFLGPIANKHTANDNTSGVITLCELYAVLTPEEREQVCFVFFDNEENGLLGSAGFARKHKKDGLKEKLVINFDCVSEGDRILLATNKTVLAKFKEDLTLSFTEKGGKSVDLTTKAFYPSDQANFFLGVGVAALRHHKVLGFFMDKIHTNKDTVFQEENIAFLTESGVNLVKKVCHNDRI